MSGGEQSRRAPVFAMALLLSIGACAHKRTTVKEVSGAEARVGKIDIHGNKALDDEKIEEHMNLKETEWFPKPTRRWYLEGLVPIDRKRIEELYAAHGYYAANVEKFEPRFRKKGKVVDLHVDVQENEPTLVRSLVFHWPEGPPKGPPDKRADPRRIVEHCELAEGKPFDIEKMEESESTMRAALMQRGYAFAEVEASARVDRVGRIAHVEFDVVPGQFVRIGEIRVSGLVDVPEKPVRVEVEGWKGKPFSPDRIDAIEDAVYGLDVFSTVTVVPDKEAKDGKLGVTIEVVESKPQSVKLGVGLGLDPNRWEQFGSMTYTHANLGKKLLRFDLRVKAGYAELPAIWRPEEHGPIGLVEPSLRHKGFLEKKLVWTLTPSFELGIQRGYQFYSPRTRVGVSRFFTRFFELELSHNFRFVDFFSVDPALNTSDSILGLDFRDPYILSYIELKPTVHLTDRILEPSNGVVLGVTYNLAGGIFGGDYDYNRLTPEVRAYYTPLKNRLQLAGRAQTGFIIPFGDEPGAPFDLKYYLGGSNTVRGYGVRQISPSIPSCDADGTDCNDIPVGGETMVSGNFEIRARAWKGLWFVAFTDMGDVRGGLFEFAPSKWSYTVGPGVRYHSKIGVFRLDVGFRVNKTEYGEGQPIAAVHFGLGEAF